MRPAPPMEREMEIAVKAADQGARRRAKERWDSIAKPLGSLGVLEEMVITMAGVQGTENVRLDPAKAVVMCGDHGVVAQGVTQCESDVTAKCAAEIAMGRSNVNAMAEVFGIDVMAVDMGIKNRPDCERLIDRSLGQGTADFTLGPAMERRAAQKAIETGICIAGELKAQGVMLLMTGEMGIGNTTSAAALASVMLGMEPEKVTGRGAGLDREGLSRKIAAVKRAIEVNRPDPQDPVGLLAKLGGFEIGGMTGLFLGCACYGMTAVADGVISAAAAALAAGIEPGCADYILGSHCSGEPAARGLLEKAGLLTAIDAGLRLGEGTGGVLLYPLLKGALAVYENSHRFEETGIERYVELK